MFDYRMASNFNGAWYLSEVNPGLSVQNVTFIFDIPKDAKGLKLIADKGVGKVPPILLQ